MDNRHPIHLKGGVAAFLTTGLLAFPVAHAAEVVQTVNDTGTGWNSALWGSPAAAPTAGNGYVTAAFALNDPSRLGTPNLTGRIRAITGQETFTGDALDIVPTTELLIKNGGTYTANITLNGGLIRHSPNAAAAATLTGTLHVAADSVLGSVQSGTQVFTIASTITGNSTLRLAGGTAANQTITFDDGAGTSLSGFAGTLDIGGGLTNAGAANLVTVDFNQPYDMSGTAVVMGGYATADVLNLDANITVESFTFAGAPLAGGIYDVATLNATFGTGTQFTGTGTLTVTGAIDSDDDGLPDTWETSYAGNLTDLDGTLPAGSGPGAGTGDFDGDGLSDADELAESTSPIDPDSDDDGLNDGPEIAGTDNNDVSHGFGPTDPNLFDSDGDGLGDGAELAGTDNDDVSHGFGPTDPLFADSDNDTLEDGAEVAGTDNDGFSHGFGPTNPNDAFSDDDDLPDDWEITFFLNPNSSAGDDGNEGDLDADGLDNFGEYVAFTDPGISDTDGDGLEDGPEVNGTRNDGTDHGFGPTNPLAIDTDGDGFDDWFELELATDPNDSNSLPGTAAPIVNGGFESPPVAVSTEAVPVSSGTVPGWTVVTNDFYVTDFLPAGLGTGNPGAPSEGAQFATAERRAPNPPVEAASLDGGTAATMSMRQDIDMSSLSTEIDAGARSLLLSFDFFDNDAADEGVVTMQFLDGSNNDLGRRVVYRSPATTSAAWQAGNLTGYPPVGTRTVRLTVETILVGEGSARNFAIDNMRARLFHFDADNDDMPDDWELANGLDTTVDDSGDHWDGDTLTNLEEFQNGTDPNWEDTDGDGHNDDVEIAAGSDPLDASSIPGGASSGVSVVSTDVTTNGSGQVTQVQITFSGLDTSKSYTLLRGIDLVTFPDTVDTHQPSAETEAFTDSSPVPQATSGKAFYILEETP